MEGDDRPPKDLLSGGETSSVGDLLGMYVRVRGDRDIQERSRVQGGRCQKKSGLVVKKKLSCLQKRVLAPPAAPKHFFCRRGGGFRDRKKTGRGR